jgi:hypothetical protein
MKLSADPRTVGNKECGGVYQTPWGASCMYVKLSAEYDRLWCCILLASPMLASAAS